MKTLRKRKTNTCVVCQTTLVGRKDKVYCDTQCKNILKEKVRKSIYKLYGKLNKRQFRNLTILEGAFIDSIKKVIVHRDVLFEHGFDITGYQDIDWLRYKRVLIIGNFSIEFRKKGMLLIKRLKKSRLNIKELNLRWNCELVFKRMEGCDLEEEFVRNEVNNSVLGLFLSVKPFLYLRTGALTYKSP